MTVQSFEVRSFAGANELEAHDFVPPTDAAVHIGDRQIDVPKALDRRQGHAAILSRQERKRLRTVVHPERLERDAFARREASQMRSLAFEKAHPGRRIA
jgi:hypothetical protein